MIQNISEIPKEDLLTYSFTKIPDILKKSSRVLRVDLQISKNLTGNDKILWSHLLARYRYLKGYGKVLSETQLQISDNLGVSERNARDSLKKLKELGVVLVRKQRASGNIQETVYDSVQDPSSVRSLLFFDTKDRLLDPQDFLVRKQQDAPVQ